MNHMSRSTVGQRSVSIVQLTNDLEVARHHTGTEDAVILPVTAFPRAPSSNLRYAALGVKRSHHGVSKSLYYHGQKYPGGIRAWLCNEACSASSRWDALVVVAMNGMTVQVLEENGQPVNARERAEALLEERAEASPEPSVEVPRYNRIPEWMAATLPRRLPRAAHTRRAVTLEPCSDDDDSGEEDTESVATENTSEDESNHDREEAFVDDFEYTSSEDTNEPPVDLTDTADIETEQVQSPARDEMTSSASPYTCYCCTMGYNASSRRMVSFTCGHHMCHICFTKYKRGPNSRPNKRPCLPNTTYVCAYCKQNAQCTVLFAT